MGTPIFFPGEERMQSKMINPFVLWKCLVKSGCGHRDGDGKEEDDGHGD